MLKENFIAIVGPNQFEINIPYHAESNLAKSKYNTNIYLFIPKTLNINPESYSKKHFYNDYISYIRFMVPRKKLGVLERELKGLIASVRDKKYTGSDHVAFEKALKLIVSGYVSYLETFSREFQYENIRLCFLNAFLGRILRLQVQLRTLISDTREEKDQAIGDAVLSASELLSYAAQSCLLEITTHLRSHGNPYPDRVSTIVDIINQLILFCKENDFPVISNDTYRNEKIIYRHSILKKYFNSVLFLYQKKKKDGGGIKELYYAIAAGISMVFATLVVFATQKQYGNFTTSFFAALVISYMFKDRIKEAYRAYFDKRLAIKNYDYKEKIYSADQTLVFAFIKERMRFVQRNLLKKEIQELRLLEVPRRLTSYIEEDIIQFNKRVTLYNRNIKKKYQNRITGIHNVMRFDLSEYFKKMDATKVPLYRVRDSKLMGSRTYHINVIVENKTEEGTQRYRARIVASKKGIRRIEVLESGLRIFPRYSAENPETWFVLKKSGLIKKQPDSMENITSSDRRHSSSGSYPQST